MVLSDDSLNLFIPDTIELVIGILCFVIFWIIINKKFVPKINEVLENRSNTIDNNIKQSKEEYNKAQQLYKQYKSKEKKILQEAQEIRDKAKLDAKNIVEQAQNEATNKYNKIIDNAHKKALQEYNNLFKNMEQEICNMVIDTASSLTYDYISKDDKAKNFITETACKKIEKSLSDKTI